MKLSQPNNNNKMELSSFGIRAREMELNQS